jgi:hypothetical protein
MSTVRPLGKSSASGIAPGSTSHLRQNLASQQFDARKNLVLAHAWPTYAHGKVVDPDPVLSNEGIDDLRWRTYSESIRGEVAQLLLGRSIWVEGEPFQSPGKVSPVFFDQEWRDAAESTVLIGRAPDLE